MLIDGAQPVATVGGIPITWRPQLVGATTISAYGGLVRVPLAGGRTISVGLAVENDSALAATHRKTVQVGQALETDTAQAVTAAKRFAIGQVTETDLAQPVTARKTVVIGRATETDLAQPVTHAKAKAVGQVTETDLAQALIVPKIRLVNRVTETDVAQAVTRQTAAAPGQYHHGRRKGVRQPDVPSAGPVGVSG